MRQIIFRARSKETGEWIEGNYHHNKRKGEYHSISRFDDNIEHTVYRESLQMMDYDNKWIDV